MRVCMYAGLDYELIDSYHSTDSWHKHVYSVPKLL